MQPILSRDEMRQAEQFTINDLGVPSLVLMERAALSVYERIVQMEKSGLADSIAGKNPVVVFAGTGNNGADGLALARMLQKAEYTVSIIEIGNPEKYTAEYACQRRICENLGLSILKFDTSKIKNLSSDASVEVQKLEDMLKSSAIVVDAIFGIGLNRNVGGVFYELIELLNRKKTELGFAVISVDVPSGLSCDTGEILGMAVKADETVTFQFGKKGLYLREGILTAGNITIAEVGIYDCGKKSQKAALLMAIEESDLNSILPFRPGNGNKGTFGKVLCITGSANMGGASLLSSLSCMKTGIGMLKVITEERFQMTYLQELPEAMFEPIGSMTDVKWKQSFDWCDVILLGCGIGQNPAMEEFVIRILQDTDKPMVIDADGLNILSRHMELLEKRKQKGCITILTPHPGEFAALFREPIPTKKYQDTDFIRQAAEKYGVILVAKDADTIISDGNKTFLNLSGNDGMATAGSGDVLAGIITGFTAKAVKNGNDITDAVAAAVYVHGLSGDLMAKQKGKNGLIAGDIIAGMNLFIG